MPRFAANLSWMLQEIPMLDRFATARGLGFEAVECQLPYDHPAEELARACGDEKLRFVMFNAPPRRHGGGRIRHLGPVRPRGRIHRLEGDALHPPMYSKLNFPCESSATRRYISLT